MKNDDLKIEFDVKVPSCITDSIFNTIIFQLNQLRFMNNEGVHKNIEAKVFNEIIERMKKELDNLKVMEEEE